MNIQGSKKMDYPCSEEVKSVALRVKALRQGDQEYSGIRFLDKDNKILVQEIWGKAKTEEEMYVADPTWEV